MKAETVREIVLALGHDYSRHSVERILAALTQTAEYKELMADAERLHFWFWEGVVDGFKGVPMDKYEFACEVAARNGREEPNAEDELQGFREFTDAAIDAARGEG